MNFTDLELFGAGTAVSDTFGDHAVGHFTLIVQLQQHRHSTQHLHTSADIQAHPNWPVYVFEHPPPRLASRRPIWSDMTSVSTQLRSGERTGRRRLWSTTQLLPTLLSDSQVSIFLVVHGP